MSWKPISTLTIMLALGASLAGHAEGPILHLRKDTRDPLMPAVRAYGAHEALRLQVQASQHTGKAFLVQFRDKATPALQAELKRLGVRCYAPVPEQALVVLMDEAQRRRVEALPFVRWVGPYLPTHKLEEGLDERVETGDGERIPCSILALDARHARNLVPKLRQLGVVAELLEGGCLSAELDGIQLGQVSGMDEVLFIDRITEGGFDMDLVRESSGANALETVAGYAGQGVSGEAIDGGFRTTHQAFKANPLKAISNSTDTSHGTRVASCTFGGGDAAGRYRGAIPKANAYVAARDVVASGRRTHAQMMVDPAKPYRIVFQTYSFGGGLTRNYTTTSATIDALLFDLDYAMFQSQSNSGNQDSRPEAWAKNIISIGGMNGKGTLDMADDGKSGASTGPASDGRIKPDLAHYFTVTCATNTSDTSFASTSGTSFSTPATAGLSGLFYQMWADGVFDGGPGKNRDVFATRPHMATAKAVLVNTARQWTFNTSTSANRGRHLQGWGMVDAKGMYDVAKAGGWRFPILVNETAPLVHGGTHAYSLACDGTRPLKATLVYKDLPGNPAVTKARINDLTLKVTSPTGVIYWGNNGLKDGNWSAPGGKANDVDTTENVFIEKPASGTWKIEVLGSEIIKDAHKATAAVDAVYALVVQGGKNAGVREDAE